MRAVSASAAVVLVRAARTDGIHAAKPATATASATIQPTSATVTGGGPTLPTSPAPGLAINGATNHPRPSPTAAPTNANVRYSSRSTPATSRGVAPMAFRRPTRRVRSAKRPPTITAKLATARRSSSALPTRRPRWKGTVAWLSTVLTRCHGSRYSTRSPAWASTKAEACDGSTSLRFNM